MTTRTYYDIPFELDAPTLHTLTVRALRRIVEKHGQTVTFDEIIDGMFGTGSTMRRGVIQQRVLLVRKELDELCDLNPTLIEVGELGIAQAHGYRLTKNATQLTDGGEER